jgi:hypothetical protein
VHSPPVFQWTSTALKPSNHCGKTGHISKECDLRHDIRHMTLDEQDEFIQNIMANRDAAVAAAAESTTYTATSEGTLVEREVEDADFVQSSG